MLGILLTTFLAVPEGYTQGKTVDNCTVNIGPKAASGIAKVYVDCLWSDISVSKLDGLLGDVEIHEDIFPSIALSEVLSETGGVKRARQIHVNPGISDREVIHLHGRSEKGAAIQHWWRKDPSQDGVTGDNVEPDKSNGYWLLEADGAGTHLGYALQYEPGGSVPGFVISAFQSGGVLDFVTSVGKYARAH